MGPQQNLNVTKVVNYSESVKDYLKTRNDDDNKEKESVTFGGIFSSDIGYAWLCNGPHLEILSTKNGSKIAAWTFGEVIKDYFTKITCVIDLPVSKSPILIVGLQSSGTRGMICIFDIRTSRILRAIQFSTPVSSIHVVDTNLETNFPGQLCALDGILAVGTEQGHIYLIDLCLQQCEEAVSSLNKSQIRDEIYACELYKVPLSELSRLEKHKEDSLKCGDHICLQLNENCTDNHFELRNPNNEVRLRANIIEVKISALHFCQQLGSLLVGYNFGAFQIYNLLSLKLEYTSPAYEDCIPISHFAFQEPCDDPRAFCYVWVMYSNIDPDLNGFPLAVMYSLSYETKEFLEGYGNLYNSLQNCSIRFQTELKPLTTRDKPQGGSCITLKSYTRHQKPNEDNLTVCHVVWATYSEKTIETFTCVFDLNQWYKEQMPSTPKEPTTPYLQFTTLTHHLLDLKIDPKTITQFSSNSPHRLEEHFFPNALSYNLIGLTEEGILHLNNVGLQKSLLASIKQAGPLILLRPFETYKQCIAAGLTPLIESNPDEKGQREVILNVALENQLISFLCQCVSDWSNGSHSVAGCTLEFLQEWGWKRMNVLKDRVNDICKTLFDYSGVKLDQNGVVSLNHCGRQLKNLGIFYEYGGSGKAECKTVGMISTYVEVLQWLVNVGLLPECPLFMYPRDEEEKVCAPYPVGSLVRYYGNRREELFKLQGLQHTEENESCDLLFIDNLIEIEFGGGLLRSDWVKDGGRGIYPPPSLQALLRTYLIENVDIVHKHCIFIYLFLDLAMTLDQSRYSPIITHLIKFPAVFKLSPSIIKITQAFWQLDHGDFSTAMAQLLDPLISNEVLQSWHHRIAVKALLAQGQHQHALLYHQVRKPPITKLQDLIITITVLIVNDLLKEAFHFQRQNHSDSNQRELIRHFVEVCDKTNLLYQVIQLPLNEIEELELIKYLQENRRDDTENYLIQYFLQRSRFAEAFKSNPHNALITRYKSTLPTITQDILSNYLTKSPRCKVFDKPIPMSVHVHQSQDKLKYKSSLIQASLNKTKEIFSPTEKSIPFLSTPKGRNSPSVTTPIIIPITIADTDYEGPASKRVKLTPRKSIGENKSNLLSLTPLVKRNSPITSREVSIDSYLSSPQSILKVRKLVGSYEKIREDSVTPEFLDEGDVFGDLTKETVKNSLIDLSDYDINEKSSKVSGVRFEEGKRASISSSEGSESVEIEMEVGRVPEVVKGVQERNVPIIVETEIAQKTSTPRKRKLNDSVQSRRSYKENSFNNTSEMDKELKSTPKSATLEIKTNFPKLSGRKSLTRKVLEQNTLAKALSSPRRGLNRSNASGVETTRVETTKSLVKETFINKIHKSENKNVFEVRNTYSSEIDPNTSSQVIKISRNESLTKSSSKLTEFINDSDSDISSIDPILNSGSDIDESFLLKYVKTSPSLNNISESLLENTEEDITEDILQEENEDIVEIQSLDQDNKDNIESTETEEFISIEDSENKDDEIEKEKNFIVNIENNQQFEITDDLTDEDVSFTIHSTMNVGLNPNKDIEPENYLEPNFEEEVGNVLGEDSEVDEKFLSKYTKKEENILPIVGNIEETSEEEKISDQEEEQSEVENDTQSEREENIEKIEVSEESGEEEEEETSEEEEEEQEKSSDEESEKNDVIEIGSSSDEEMRLHIEESQENSQESSSLDVLEKNIIDSNISEGFETNISDGTFQQPRYIELAPMKVVEDLPTEEIIEETPIEEQNFLPQETVMVEEMSSGTKEKVEPSSRGVGESKLPGEERSSATLEKEVPKDKSGRLTRSRKPSVEVEEILGEAERRSKRGCTTSAPKKLPQIQEDVKPLEEISSGLEEEAKSSRKERKASVQKDLSEEKIGTGKSKLVDVAEEERSSGNEEDDRSSRRERKYRFPKENIEDQITTEKSELPNVVEEKRSCKIEEEVKEEAKSFRRGRKPSVPKELPETKTIMEKSELSNLLEEERSSGTTAEEKVTSSGDIEEVRSSRRGRKPSLSKELPEKITEEQLEKKELATLMEKGRASGTFQEEEKSSSIIDERRKSPSRRGRKPSVTKEIPEDKIVTEKTSELPNVVEEEISRKEKEKTSENMDMGKSPSRRGRKPSIPKEILFKDTNEEEIVPKRRTRSASIQEEESVPEESTSTPRRGRRPSVDIEDVSTPARRTTRRSSLQLEVQEVETPSRRSTRRSSIQSETQELPKIMTPSRRTRKLSTQSEDVNVSLTPSRRGRKPSVQSEDATLTPRRTRASSVLSDNVPVKSSSDTSLKVTGMEKIEEYEATHRLTRRQKVIIEEKMKEKGPLVGNIDPMTLLDKETFAGEPDLDEEIHRNKSPASSIGTESSVGTRSSLRIQSKRTTPDRSYTESPSLPSTPRRGKTRSSIIKIEEPIIEEQGIEDIDEPSTSSGKGKRKNITDYAIQKVLGSPAKRSRKHSEESIVSEASVKSEAIVKLKKLNEEDIDRFRHRSLSPTLKAEKIESPSRVQRKGRHSILAKTELSKISEENASNANEDEEGPKKRGRPKKNN